VVLGAEWSPVGYSTCFLGGGGGLLGVGAFLETELGDVEGARAYRVRRLDSGVSRREGGGANGGGRHKWGGDPVVSAGGSGFWLVWLLGSVGGAAG